MKFSWKSRKQRSLFLWLFFCLLVLAFLWQMLVLEVRWSVVFWNCFSKTTVESNTKKILSQVNTSLFSTVKQKCPFFHRVSSLMFSTFQEHSPYKSNPAELCAVVKYPYKWCFLELLTTPSQRVKIGESLPYVTFPWCFLIKTECTRKLSNFNSQWTKTLHQNNLKNIAFFFTFFKG